MTHALKIENISKTFGGLVAVDGFNLSLAKGAIQGVIGPNGAGKTTVFNLITGVYPPDSGDIWLHDKKITGQFADAIARAGISRTFQNIRLFQEMSVWENVKVAFHARATYGFFGALLHSKDFKISEEKINLESLEYLNYFGLQDRRDALAKNLSYGDQRKLEIARALATGSKVLLLDEPAAGINPKELHALIDLIRRVHKDFSLSILLIEHQMPLVMELCQHVQVLNFGKMIAEGSPSAVTNHPEVLRAYLGEAEVA